MTDVFVPADAAGLKAQAEAEAQAAARRGEDLMAMAGEVAALARERIARIRNDERLTDEAKAADVAPIVAARNAKMKALGEELEVSLGRELDTLRRRLCTPPPSAAATGAEIIARDASFRDALQRARQTKPRDGVFHQLLGLSDTARLTGDSLQERAAMVVALERNDVDVLNAWIKEHPDDAEILQRAYDLHDRITDRKARFGRALQFRPG